MKFDFAGKSVVVTGVAGILGQSVANAFHAASAHVFGIDVARTDAIYETIELDLTNHEECVNTFDSIPQIDVLCNIAGGFVMGESVAKLSDETWNFMMNLNVRTCLNTVRAAVPKMQTRGGKIVNVGARAALKGAGRMAAYCASKSVVIRLTESLAEELKHKKINVNCVLPSIIDTPRNRTDMPNADFGSWVTPDDLANVILFLSSRLAESIHGAAIPVDGLV